MAAALLSVPAIVQTNSLPADFTGSISAGLALTGGNTDTAKMRFALALIRDVRTNNIINATALVVKF